MIDVGQLSRCLRAHGALARIVVAETKGSAPRGVGASMVVWPDGFEGSIGGGRLEWEAIAKAREMLRSAAAHSVHRIPLGPGLGQCCGGAVTLVIERWDKAALGNVGNPHMRCVQGSKAPPRKAPRQTAMMDGWLSEPVLKTRHGVHVHGGGHVGQALAGMLAPMGDVSVTVWDTRAEILRTLPAGVTALHGTVGTKGRDALPKDAVHYIMTHDHGQDLEICHALLSHGFRAAGLIGSATKWARFRARLSALGHEDAQIGRIECPIGDPNLGKEPQAIAIGVAARLLSTQKTGDKT